MSSVPQSYMPCLRWKMGEYQALQRSRSEVLDFLVPLVEIAEIGYDFEERAVCRSIDEHLAPLAKRVCVKLGRRPCFVDMRYIDPGERMRYGVHPATFLFDQFRSISVPAIPTFDLRQDNALTEALRVAAQKDGRGALLRVRLDEVVRKGFSEELYLLLSRIGLLVSDCHLALDLETPNFLPMRGLVALVSSAITSLPQLERWQSFTVLATSFPASMAGLPEGISRVDRHEWTLYRSLVRKLLADGIRIPRFGDYGIAHPAVIQQDLRYVKPYATVRYTIADGWLIARGQNVRDHGYHQFRALSRMVLGSENYEDPTFSLGDQYIAGCAAGQKSTGNLTTWRWVGTNHHLARVVREISSLSATSSAV